MPSPASCAPIIPTLSQILRGTRPAPAPKIRAWAALLGLSKEEAAAYIVAEQSLDIAAARRQRQMHHWTAEALSVTTEPVHWEIRLVRQHRFRDDSRWIASQTGSSVDAVKFGTEPFVPAAAAFGRRAREMEGPDRFEAPDRAGIPQFGATEDAAAAVKKAEQLGAKVLIPLTVLPQAETMAVLHDPQGMSFGIWQAAA